MHDLLPGELEVKWVAGPKLAPGWPPTLPAWWRQAALRHGQTVVLVDQETTWSWPDLLATAAAWAHSWEAVQPGDRVVIHAGNGAGHLLAELATWMRGGIAVPLAPSLPIDQRRVLIERVAPALIVADDENLPESLALNSWQTLPRPSSAQLPMDLPVLAPQPDDPALILFTSGSSGQPKGVVLSHRNICSQQAAFAQLWPHIGPGDRCVSYLPWHHSFGALAERLWALGRGVSLHVVPGGGHDHAGLLQMLAAVRPTIFMSVPKLHHLVAEAGVLCPQSTRWVFTAGAPLGHAAEAAYRRQGITVLEGWGLTEASPSVTITGMDDRRGGGLVGRPIPGVRVGLSATDEILVDGPGVMLGYWRDPQNTAAALIACDDRRWLRSGDLGRWTDDGLLIEGRVDHQLKHPNGEKVPQQALELELAELLGSCGDLRHVQLSVDQSSQGLLPMLVFAGPWDGAQIHRLLLARNDRCPIPWWRFRRAAIYDGPLTTANGLLTSSHKVCGPRLLASLHDQSGYRCWHSMEITQDAHEVKSSLDIRADLPPLRNS